MSFQEASGDTKEPVISSQYDIHTLLADTVPARRAAGVRQIAADMESGALSARELETVRDALRLFANDTELTVRLALAGALKNSHHMPRDVAVTLAQDVFNVAKLVLESSPAFLDEDLIAIVGEAHGASQVAVARRPSIGGAVALAIVDSRNAAAVTALAANVGAMLDEPILHRILDRYSNFETVKASLAERDDLPAVVCERLLPLVPGHLKAALTARQAAAEAFPEVLAVEVADELGVADGHVEVVRLRAQGELTPAAVLRALCAGNIRFVEDAMAEISGFSAEKACLLIHDESPFGLKAIYRKCSFPEQLFPAFRVALDLAQELEIDRCASDPERFERAAVERILTRYRELEAADLDYVLTRLSRHQAA